MNADRAILVPPSLAHAKRPASPRYRPNADQIRSHLGLYPLPSSILPAILNIVSPLSSFSFFHRFCVRSSVLRLFLCSWPAILFCIFKYRFNCLFYPFLRIPEARRHVSPVPRLKTGSCSSFLGYPAVPNTIQYSHIYIYIYLRLP